MCNAAISLQFQSNIWWICLTDRGLFVIAWCLGNQEVHSGSACVCVWRGCKNKRSEQKTTIRREMERESWVSLHDWRCRGKWQSTSPRSHPRRAQPITMQIRAGCGLAGLLRCNHISWPERKWLPDLNHWRLERRSRRGTTFSLPKPPVPHLHNNVINKPNMSARLCAWELASDTRLVGWSCCYVQTY